MIFFFLIALSSCNIPGGAPIFYPRIGMSYGEFEALSTRSLAGRPIAITSHNNIMIYVVPYHSEEYYWFENGYFIKMTTRFPDDDKAWRLQARQVSQP